MPEYDVFLSHNRRQKLDPLRCFAAFAGRRVARWR